jgi:hypothetical protein
MNPSTPSIPACPLSRRQCLSFLLATASTPLLGLLGCATASPTGLHRTPIGRTTDFQQYRDLLIPDLAERVTERAPLNNLDRRQERDQEIARAVVELADRLARDITASGLFPAVRRDAASTATKETLILDATLQRYHRGDAAARLDSWNTAGGPQVEIRVTFRDGASGDSLATLIAENSTGGAFRTPQATQSIQGAVDRVIDHILRSLQELRNLR